MSERELQLQDALTAYFDQIEAGHEPDRDTFVAQYPAFADELKRFFDNRACVERLATPLKQHLTGLQTLPHNIASPTPFPTSPWRPQPPLAPPIRGRVFGDYEILDEIAAGGMGIVYKARQISLNRIVALKRIRAGALATAEDIQRFRAEAEEAANLDHPNIVPIYEIGIHEGQSYFSMKLIEGSDLAHEIKRLSQDQKQVARLMATVARTIHYAHQRGILHRDLKPANVLIDARGEPHITDFGLAKRLDGNAALTESGAIVGTPSYMAPEQATGRGRLTTAVDVYAVGAVLYELLTSRPPFHGLTPLETVKEVLENEPERPRSLNRHVARDLETICLKCLNKDPQRRYSSAEALAEDLERWLHLKPIKARRTSSVERIVKWARRRPAGALVVLCLIVIFASVVWNWKSTLTLHAEQASVVYLQSIALAERELMENNIQRAAELLDSKACPEHLRGWEWNYLHQLRHPDADTLRGHVGPLFCVAISPNGRLIASGSGDTNKGEVILWDLADGREREHLEGHQGFVRAVTFSPDGKLLATASSDRTVKIWEVATGRCLKTLDQHTVHLWCATFSPDGQRLASGGGGLAPTDDGEIIVWNTATWEPEHTLRRPGDRIWSLAFHPRQNRLAAAGEDHTIKVWDLSTGQEVQTLHGHRASALCLGYSPDGKFLASGSGIHYQGDVGEVILWDARTGKQIIQLRGHTDEVWALAFHPSDSRRLFTGSHDRTMKVWDLVTGQEALTLRGHTDNVRAIAMTPDGTRLVSSSEDGSLKIWDSEARSITHEPADVLQGHTDRVWGAAFSTKDSLLATGSEDRSIKLWNWRDPHLVDTWQGHTGPVRYVAFSPDGRRLASASYDNTVKIWNVAHRTEERTLPRLSGWVHALAFSPDGRELATVNNYHIIIWNPDTGQELRNMGNHGWVVSSIAYSPDGKWIVTGGWDQVLKVWERATGKFVKVLTGHHGRVRSLDFQPGGGRLASASHDSTVKLWSIPGGKELQTLSGHTGKVLSVSFSHDGKYLASAGTDEAVKIWEIATSKNVHTLRGHFGHVRHAVFGPDNYILAVSSGDETRGDCKVWNVTKFIKEAQATAP